MAGRKKTPEKCKGCKNNVTKTQDSIQCHGQCRGWFHKDCTKLSHREYEVFRKKQAKWICYICSILSASEVEFDVDSSAEETDNEAVTSPIINKRLSSGSRLEAGKTEAILNKSDPSNKELLQVLTKKFDDLEDSVKFNSNIMDSMQKVLKSIQNENKKLKKEHSIMKTKILDLENELATVKNKLNREEIGSKANNVIVVGLVGGDDASSDIQKVFKKLKFQGQNDDYTVHSLPSQSQNKPVLVKFKNPEHRSNILELRKKKQSLETVECGILGEKRIIYINEDLPVHIRELYREARKLKNHGYRYVWCKAGKIFARKDEGQPLIKIFNSSQVDEIINQ